MANHTSMATSLCIANDICQNLAWDFAFDALSFVLYDTIFPHVFLHSHHSWQVEKGSSPALWNLCKILLPCPEIMALD